MIVGRILHAFHSFCVQVRGWVVPALNGDRKWSWQYLKPQDPVGLFHLATWTWLNSLCKMKSWSREIYLLKSSSSYSGRCESETGVLVSCLPSPRSPAPGTEAAGLLSVRADLAAWEGAAAAWALHKFPASEKRGFPPTYFQQRIRGKEVLPLECHLDFCVIFQGGLRDCPLKHKDSDEIQEWSLVWKICHFRVNQT